MAALVPPSIATFSFGSVGIVAGKHVLDARPSLP
jgi:hypothetical protein